jgi:hypothetical protein
MADAESRKRGKELDRKSGTLGKRKEEASDRRTSCERTMKNGSMDSDYCQDIALYFYHSNVRRGSGIDGIGWREFRSLVRRFRSSE